MPEATTMNQHTVASDAHTASTTGQALRPRNKRLVSGLSDNDELDFGSSSGTRLASPRATPWGSPGRIASPIPSAHPSRSSSRREPPADTGVGEGGIGAGQRNSSASSFNSLWGTSWSALQGLASNVLGAQVQDGGGAVSPKGKGRMRKPLEFTHGKRRVASSAPPAQWGPGLQAQPDLGAGSKEGRDAATRARKRMELLDASSYNVPDVNGKYKRRMSDDRTITGASDGVVHSVVEDTDADALVYIHKVKPQDTLSGLAIRYSCPAQVLQKANRMWAHDSVQTRKTLVLPVDVCAVKGKPVSGPLVQNTEDLMQFRDLTPRKEKVNPIGELPNGWHNPEQQLDSQPQPGLDLAPSTAASSVGDAGPPWKHDSWVLLPNETAPTEIARLSRRALGYFPPARRKSQSYSDGGTPSVSFDLPQPPASPLAVSSSTSESTDAATRAALDRVRGGTRSARSSSMASSASNTANLAPPKWLLGPGGVGTLDRSTRTPGPAPDSLNRLLAPHLPDVHPPPGTTFLPPPSFPSILDDDFQSGNRAFRTGPYGRHAAGTSNSANDAGVDFAKGLSGVETWVRKLATRSYSALSDSSARPSSRARATGGGPNAAAASIAAGDLIELMEPVEIGGVDDGDQAPDGPSRDAVASARPDAPAGMNRRLARSPGRAKSGKDD